MNFFNKFNKEWCGIVEPSILNPKCNLGQVILSTLTRDSEKIAQICADTGAKLSRKDLRLKSIRIAQHLTAMGYQKGDTVLIAANNSENVAPVMFGCFLIGAPVNPLAADSEQGDFEYMMGITKPLLVFGEEFNLEKLQKAAKNSNTKSNFYAFGSSKINEIWEETGTEHQYVPKYLGDTKKLLAVIFSSSGTTGHPKAVCLSHAHLVSNTTMRNMDDGIGFNFSSIYWGTGFTSLLLMAFNGSTRLITSRKFDANFLFDMVEKYKVNMISTIPAFAALLLNHPRLKSVDFSSLKCWHMSGTMVHESLKQAINNVLPNGRSCVGYGIAEMGYVTFDNFGQKEHSVGHLIPNMKGKIIDEQGNALNNGEEGEICLKYPYSFMGYLNNVNAYREVLDGDNWYHTGDVGYFDEDGHLFIIGRKNEVFSYLIHRVSPFDIESVIENIDGVSQVCVVGIPDDSKSTDLVTAVVIKAQGCDIDEQKIIDYVDKNVHDHKRLRGGVVFTDIFPMTSSGKVQRRKVRELVLQRG